MRLTVLLLTALVGLAASTRSLRSLDKGQQTLQASASTKSRPELGTAFKNNYPKNKHYPVLRIAYTSKFSPAKAIKKGASGGNKPWKLHMTCPAEGKEGMQARTTWYGTTRRNVKETMQDMAIKKRKFLQYASVLSTDFAGEKRFWGGLPTELTIRVTAYRTLKRFLRLNPEETTAYSDPLIGPSKFPLDRWMTKMSSYSVDKAGALVPIGNRQALARTFWTMPFSEMLFHGSHDAGCIDSIILGDAATSDVFRCHDKIDGVGGLIQDATFAANPFSAANLGMKTGRILARRAQGWCFVSEAFRRPAATQTKSISEQLQSGTRWFDIRVTRTYDERGNNEITWRLFHPFAVFEGGGNMYGEADPTFQSIGNFLKSGTTPNEVVFLALRIFEKKGAELADYLERIANTIGVQVVRKDNFPDRNPFDLTLQTLWAHYGDGTGKSCGMGAERNVVNNKNGYVVFLAHKDTYNRIPEDRRNWLWNEGEVETGTGKGNSLQAIHDGQISSADKYLGEKHEEFRDTWQKTQEDAHDDDEPREKRYFPSLVNAGCVDNLNAAVAETDRCTLKNDVMNIC